MTVSTTYCVDIVYIFALLFKEFNQSHCSADLLYVPLGFHMFPPVIQDSMILLSLQQYRSSYGADANARDGAGLGTLNLNMFPALWRRLSLCSVRRMECTLFGRAEIGSKKDMNFHHAVLALLSV